MFLSSYHLIFTSQEKDHPSGTISLRVTFMQSASKICINREIDFRPTRFNNRLCERWHYDLVELLICQVCFPCEQSECIKIYMRNCVNNKKKLNAILNTFLSLNFLIIKSLSITLCFSLKILNLI